MTDLRVSQVGVEVWLTSQPGTLVVSQVGVEVWLTSQPGTLVVSQVGVEVWTSSLYTDCPIFFRGFP